jgi:hypothetical protein
MKNEFKKLVDRLQLIFLGIFVYLLIVAFATAVFSDNTVRILLGIGMVGALAIGGYYMGLEKKIDQMDDKK